MPFSSADLLNADTAARLRTIIFYRMRLDLLGTFGGLLTSEKRTFNLLMNEFIATLPDEGWEKVVTDEFNEIVLKNILNDKFDASRARCAVVGMGVEQFLSPLEEAKEETAPQGLASLTGGGV